MGQSAPAHYSRFGVWADAAYTRHSCLFFLKKKLSFFFLKKKLSFFRAPLVGCIPLGSHVASNFRPVWMPGPSRVLALTGSQSTPRTGPGGTPGMAVSPGPGPLRPEGCTRGEGRWRRRVPSGTRVIISLTAPLSFLSLATALSPPPNCHITRRFPSRRPIHRTAAWRSTGTRGGGVGEQHDDIDRNLLRSLHRHLEFARDLDLVLGRNNGGNDLSFSPSFSFCHNKPLSGIFDDM
jgi:hypothetical protein